MVTATLAASVFAQLMQEFPGILPAFGPGVHILLCKQFFPHFFEPNTVHCSTTLHVIFC